MTENRYKQMTSTPVYPAKNKENKNFKSSIIILPCCLLLSFVAWQLMQSSLIQILKSVSAGFLLVYYSWELIYFDSLTPGIQPPSPLSPPIIRTVSGHTLHLNYALAVVIGIFFTLFVNWYT